MPALHSNIFDTVPKKDFLSLYNSAGEADYKKVTDLLKFKKKDVAAAVRIPESSVRYDDRMPEILMERINQWASALQLVAQHFKGDPKKTILWFTTPNYLLGGVSPRDMIRYGRFNKLFKFIQNSIQENQSAH